MRLETDRLLLRSLRSDDIHDLVALWNDRDVTRFLGGPRDPEQVRQILESELAEPSEDPFGQWPLFEKATGALVGDCGLMQKDVEGTTHVELVYVLAASAWGKGYATEVGTGLMRFAFDTLELDHLISLIEPENRESRRVARKLGMQLQSLILRPDGVERELWMVSATGV